METLLNTSASVPRCELATSRSRPRSANHSNVMLDVCVRIYLSKQAALSTWGCPYPRQGAMWGTASTAALVPNCGATRRWVVSLTLRSLYLPGKSTRFLLNIRLGGPRAFRASKDDPTIVQPVAVIVQPTRHQLQRHLAKEPTNISPLFN